MVGIPPGARLFTLLYTISRASLIQIPQGSATLIFLHTKMLSLAEAQQDKYTWLDQKRQNRSTFSLEMNFCRPVLKSINLRVGKLQNRIRGTL